jgi:DNA-binding transcriptional MerR regulator
MGSLKRKTGPEQNHDTARLPSRHAPPKLVATTASPAEGGQRQLPGAEPGPSPLTGIGDVARRFGITLRALRFYESKGLLQPLRDGHARYYNPRDLVRIEMILKGKQLGFTLAEITSIIGDGRNSQITDLILTPQQILGQIAHFERVQRESGEALAKLRKRYYLMSEPATP